MTKENDFMELYQAWKSLPNGSKAELRRCTKPDDLLEVPAFYRLFGGRGEKEWQKKAYQRLIFCLPCIEHTEQKISLGGCFGRWPQRRATSSFRKPHDPGDPQPDPQRHDPVAPYPQTG